MCVILAHVNAPVFISFIRCFDVPFLIMISASLAVLTDKKEAYQNYVWKRVKRLVFPAWMYLAFCTCTFTILKIKTPAEMVPSFLFQKYHFGFVWIIFLFFIMALIVPVFRKAFAHYSDWKIQQKIIIAIFLTGAGIIFEFICTNTNLYAISILEYTFFYFIPYGIVSILGIIAVKMQRSKLFMVSLFFTFICLGSFLLLNHTSKPFLPTIYNQPARMYYISFSMAISFFLYFLFRNADYKLFKFAPIIFLSSHSLWIYLWHSFVLAITLKVSSLWVLRYIFTIIISCLIVAIQNYIVSKIPAKNRLLKEFLALFKG